MLDPIVINISKNNSFDHKNIQISNGVFFSGNLCLSTDIIQRHKTFLEKLPRIGDIIAFVNTAGYLMDFSETQSLQQNIARKIAIKLNEGKEIKWFLDETYSIL